MVHDAEKERKFAVEYLKEMSEGFLKEINSDPLFIAMPYTVKRLISRCLLTAAEKIEQGAHIPSKEDLLLKEIQNIFEKMVVNGDTSKIPVHETVKITSMFNNINCEDKESYSPKLTEIYNILLKYVPEYVSVIDNID